MEIKIVFTPEELLHSVTRVYKELSVSLYSVVCSHIHLNKENEDTRLLEKIENIVDRFNEVVLKLKALLPEDSIRELRAFNYEDVYDKCKRKINNKWF